MPAITTLASMSKNGFSSSTGAASPSGNSYFNSTQLVVQSNTAKQTIPLVLNNTYNQITYSQSYPYNPGLFKYDSNGNPTNLVTDITQGLRPVTMLYDSLSNLHVLYDTNTNGNFGTFILQKYNSSGTLITSVQFTYTNFTISTAYTLGMIIDNSNNLYVYNSTTSTGTNIITTKILNSTIYTITSNTSINVSGSGGFTSSNQLKLLGGSNGVGLIGVSNASVVPYYTGLISISNTGSVNYAQKFVTNISQIMQDGIVLSTDLYILKYPNILIKVPISTGIPTYQYSLSYPSNGITSATNYDTISINGLNNIVLGARGSDGLTQFIVPLNSTNPPTFVTFPTAIKFTGSAGFFMAINNIDCTTTNTYLSGSINKTTSPQGYSAISLKLPPNGNLTFGPTSINYTVGATTFSGTLQGSAISAQSVSVSSATRTALSLGTASVPSSSAGASFATTTSGITTYTQQLV
jgi:hypothetical protein